MIKYYMNIHESLTLLTVNDTSLRVNLLLSIDQEAVSPCTFTMLVCSSLGDDNDSRIIYSLHESVKGEQLYIKVT